jgi:UDP-N-acetylmuramate dehydrogenase
VIWSTDCAVSTRRSSPLSRWTTLGVGGPADLLFLPESPRELEEVVGVCRDRSLPWRALGKGSNLVVADEGVRGAVIQTGGLRTLEFGPDGLVTAGAGLPTSVLLAQTRRRGLGGLECLVGYPATAGGVARMNAGGRWGFAGDRIEGVHVVDPAGRLRRIAAEDCGFGYRTSLLGDHVIAAVEFRLPHVDPVLYRGAVERIHAEKARVQPLDRKSAGCMFKNPADGPAAGKLVDELGLKGHSRGGAMVSTRHGNFIVNAGDARAVDVLDLVDEIRTTVERETGLVLELEVEVWSA